MAIQIWNGSAWVNVANVKVYDGAAWDTVDYGKIWDGAAWQNFYTRIVIQAPTITTNFTTTSITWNVTQADVAQFTAFPSEFQYYTIRPDGVRMPGVGYSTSSSRVVPPITMSGLYQDEEGALYYRLDYGGGTFYPSSGEFLVDTERTAAIPVVVADVLATAVTATSASYSVNRFSADYYDYQLYRGASLVQSASNQTATSLTFTGLIQNTTYALRVTSYYTTARPTTAQITAPDVSATTTAIAKQTPTITFVSAGYTSLTYSIDKNNADSASYELVRTADNVTVSSGTRTTTANFTISGLSPGQSYRLRAFGNFTTSFDPDEVSSTVFDSIRITDIKTAVNPVVVAGARGINSVAFSVTGISEADYYSYELRLTRLNELIASDLNVPVSTTSLSFTSVNTGDNLYPDETYRLTVTAYWSNATADFTTGADSNTTDDLPAPSSSVALLDRSVREIRFTTVRNSGTSSSFQLRTSGGDLYGSGSLSASQTTYTGGLPNGTSFTCTVTTNQTGYRSDRYSGGTRTATNSASGSTRVAGSPTVTSWTGRFAAPQLSASWTAGPGLPSGVRYSIRRSSDGALVVTNAIDTASPTTATVTRGFSYRWEGESVYDSLLGTAYAFGSNSTFGIAREITAYVFVPTAA